MGIPRLPESKRAVMLEYVKGIGVMVQVMDARLEKIVRLLEDEDDGAEDQP